MARLNKVDWSCIFGGISLIALGITLGICWPYIYDSVVSSHLRLTPTSDTYAMWIKTPLPMFLEIYMFNCTNAAEFKKNPKIKPNFEEIGPFVFREVHDRVNVTWNDDGSVSYNQTRNWTFVPEESMNLSLPITNLDVISLAVAHSTRDMSKVIQSAVNFLLRYSSSLFVTKPAGQWLFDGMSLNLLDILNAKSIKKLVPFPLPDKFGFFYQRNMSAAYDGRFTMETGSNQLNDLGMLNSWNSQNKTDFFDSYCAMVNGSSGEIFGPFAADQELYTLFITDVCSSLMLRYKQDYTVHGITGKQFIGDESLFDNGQNVTENQCFCDGECAPSGARNMTRCRQGAPVFVSFPHFYLADSSYTSGISGLSPNESLHEFRLTLEPTTGIPLDVQARLQVNLLLDRYPMYHTYQYMPRLFFPMLWFTQRAHITPPIAAQANLLLNLNIIGIAVSAVLGSLGLFILLGRGLCRYKSSNYESDEEPLIDEPSGDS